MNHEKDLFEEFEFKPLSSGLGFQKKPVDKSAPSSASPTSASSTQTSFQSLNTLEDQPQLLAKLSSTLTRPGAHSSKKNAALDFSMDLKEAPQPLIKAPNVAKAKAQNAYSPTSYEATACFVDLMMVLALFLLSLIGMLFVTEVDLFANLIQPDEGRMVYLALAGLFFSINWIYLIVNRVFLGSTPGEWVCEQTLGTPDTHGRAKYFMKVVLRSTFVLLTGWIFIPLVSFFIGEDLIGHVFGLGLVKRANG